MENYFWLILCKYDKVEYVYLKELDLFVVLLDGMNSGLFEVVGVILVSKCVGK